MLLLALFGFAVELLDFEPRRGSVIRLALFEQPRVPGQLVLGTWLVESAGLIALFLLARGRFGRWWLDGLVAGWIGWIFRGPLLVITIVVAVRQPQDPWWTLAFGWWVLYSVCGLSLAFLARRSGLDPWLVESPVAATGSVDTVALDNEALAGPVSGDTVAPENSPAPDASASEMASEVAPTASIEDPPPETSLLETTVDEAALMTNTDDSDVSDTSDSDASDSDVSNSDETSPAESSGVRQD